MDATQSPPDHLSKASAIRAKSMQTESRFRFKYLLGRMILSEKSATFRDHALQLKWLLRALLSRGRHKKSRSHHRQLLQVDQLRDALLRERQQVEELLLGERYLLGGTLHLDDPSVAGHDE